MKAPEQTEQQLLPGSYWGGVVSELNLLLAYDVLTPCRKIGCFIGQLLLLSVVYVLL